MIVDGKKIAGSVIEELQKKDRPPRRMVAFLVGDDFASQSFVKQKASIAELLGISFTVINFDEGVKEEKLIGEIKKVNEDDSVGGIIVQLPLPAYINRDHVCAAIIPEKDVDALNRETRRLLDAPAVETVREILKTKNYNLKTSIVAVVGSKGFLVGRPISEWLKGKCKKLIAIDIGDDMGQIKEADVVITGVGKAGILRPEMLKEGAGIIDFGYSVVDGKIKGDFDSSNVPGRAGNGHMAHVSWYTPTPGGTGPLLVAELFRNFYKLNKAL